MTAEVHPDLTAAVALSLDVVAAADQGDLQTMTRLDAERLRLLQSFRARVRHVGPADRALLGEISDLNDQALGMIEHRLRTIGRSLDMAAVGRRAVAAYSVNRPRR